MTSETGKRKARAFTLLEVLVALSVLVTGLILIALGLSRQFSAICLLQSSRTSHHLAERLLARELILREDPLECPPPEAPGFRSSIRTETVKIPQGSSLPDLELERVTSETVWETRGQSRSARFETGAARRASP